MLREREREREPGLLQTSKIESFAAINVIAVKGPTLREKCTNAELFLARISLYSVNLFLVNLRFHFEYRKIHTKNNPVSGHFSRSASPRGTSGFWRYRTIKYYFN